MIKRVLDGIQKTKTLTAALDHVVTVEDQVYLMIEEMEIGGVFLTNFKTCLFAKKLKYWEPAARWCVLGLVSAVCTNLSVLGLCCAALKVNAYRSLNLRVCFHSTLPCAALSVQLQKECSVMLP